MINQIKYSIGENIKMDSAKRKKSLANIVGVGFGISKKPPPNGLYIGNKVVDDN